MDVDAAADELYAVALSEFTARRNALAKLAADDDPELAGQIRALPKPSLAAWVTNTLVRSHRAEIDALLQLGTALRDATDRLHGEDLSALSKQQRQVVGALLKLAVDDAEGAGQRVSPTVARSVEQSLRAALGDVHSGEQLAAGRLTEPIEYGGFPGAVRAVDPKPRSKESNEPANDPNLAARAEARESLAEAKRQRDTADQDLTEAGRKVELLTGHLDEVRQRVKELTSRLREAERDQRAAAKTHDQATQAVETAEHALSDLA